MVAFFRVERSGSRLATAGSNPEGALALRRVAEAGIFCIPKNKKISARKRRPFPASWRVDSHGLSTGSGVKRVK